MGAISCNREKGLTTLEFFQAEFPIGLTVRGRVLASAVVKTGESARYGGWPEVFYAAVENVAYDGMTDYEASEVGKVWALVVPFVRSAGYFNMTYKDMDETMGPCEAQAPARVLDLLTPTDSEHAVEWRARCRQFNAVAAKARSVKEDDTIVLAEPIGFSNGANLDRLTLVDKRRGRWSAPGGGRYRLPVGDLIGREFTVERRVSV